jgi:hypothetical protein
MRGGPPRGGEKQNVLEGGETLREPLTDLASRSEESEADPVHSSSCLRQRNLKSLHEAESLLLDWSSVEASESLAIRRKGVLRSLRGSDSETGAKEQDEVGLIPACELAARPRFFEGRVGPASQQPHQHQPHQYCSSYPVVLASITPLKRQPKHALSSVRARAHHDPNPDPNPDPDPDPERVQETATPTQ